MMNDTFDSFASRIGALAADDPAAPIPAFEALALELFALQFHHVPPYQRFCASLGKRPDRVQTIADIPCVPTSAFKDFEFTSLGPADRSTVFHSSGTTQHRPSRHFHSKHSLDLYKRLLLPGFRRHLLPDRERLTVLSLVPPEATAPNSSLAHMIDVVIRACGTPRSLSAGRACPPGDWEIDLPLAVEALDRLCSDHEPALVIGTAYGFVHLLDHLERHARSFSLPRGSRIMETGGYKGRSRTLTKPDLHHHLSTALDVPDSHIVSEYGMSELGSQAYDRRVGRSDPRVFHFPSWCRVRVTDPSSGLVAEPGRPGLLRVLDLANVRSVLAVQTEDLGVTLDTGFDYAGRAHAAEPRGCSLMHA